MSGGSKHEQAGVAWLTLPSLVVGTFKLLPFILGYDDEEEFLTGKEIQKKQKKRSFNNLTWLTFAREAVDHVPADAIINTWVTLTVIYINLTVSSHVA